MSFLPKAARILKGRKRGAVEPPRAGTVPAKSVPTVPAEVDAADAPGVEMTGGEPRRDREIWSLSNRVQGL